MITYHISAEHTHEQLARLERACFPPRLRWNPEMLDTMLSKEGARTFSAIVGKGLVGWCITVDHKGIFPPGTQEAMEVGDLAYVASIAVHPRMQRRGIGRDLLRMAIEESKEAGDIGMVAHCQNPESLALFERCLPGGIATPCRLGTRFVASYAATFKY